MASELTVSTDVVGATSTCVHEEDPPSIVKPPGIQELGIGSTSCSLVEAVASDKNDRMGTSSDSAAKMGFQECQGSENFCGVLISDDDRVQEERLDLSGLERMHPLNDLEVGSSSSLEELSDSDGKTFFGEVGMIDAYDGGESLLEVKKKQLLDELEVGSIFQGISPTEHPGERALIVENFTDVGIVKSAIGVDDYLRSSLKIEVIDDTALIEPIVGPRIVNGKKNHSKEDVEGKNAKRTRRKGKGKKTGSEKVEDSAQVDWRSVDGTKTMYSREEMEALRFVGVAEQRKLWREIYSGLGPAVAREYMSLVGWKHHQQGKSSSEASKTLRRSHGPGILGDDSGVELGVVLEKWGCKEMNNTNLCGPSCGQSVTCEDDFTNLEEEDGDEDSEDSDEYYASIQRPAFLVKGEPNFEAGPPEDGLEYLRRVRWEAAQIPNVKVAELDKSKLNKEQSVYMPVIPEIAKCPEHLMPSKQWEDEFLADFSKLQLAFSQAETSKPKTSDKSELKLILGVKEISSHLAMLGNLENQEPADKTEASANVETPFLNALGTGSASVLPTLSLLLLMDSVSRVSNLRKRINAFEASTALSRDDCLWIFALCAAIDTPLHADTCATLRGLLRKCASLQAQKVELDDEAIMLNILATIAGRFFGQADSDI